MARPLRIQRPGGRYPVTARGKERRATFRDDRDRRRFLDLLGQLPERFGTRVHGWGLMDNHVHLLGETPEANLSWTGQWLNVSYSVWFNRRHRGSGPLFPGRFGSVLMGGDGLCAGSGPPVHLNPVRVARLGLSKEDPQRQGLVAASAAADPARQGLAAPNRRRQRDMVTHEDVIQGAA
jgi:putative transposase